MDDMAPQGSRSALLRCGALIGRQFEERSSGLLSFAPPCDGEAKKLPLLLLLGARPEVTATGTKRAVEAGGKCGSQGGVKRSHGRPRYSDKHDAVPLWQKQTPTLSSPQSFRRAPSSMCLLGGEDLPAASRFSPGLAHHARSPVL
ncbi:hypothetical protein AOLI_G00223240 [Acnodon oligacanthus]